MKVNATFNGPVGQVVNAKSIGRVDSKISFDRDGNMVVESTLTDVEDDD